MSKKFFVSTPIYYPNDKLHIGHAYTTTLADYINRYKKLDGYETYFVTGSDEHGQKIEDKAKELNQEPYNYVTSIVETFKDLWVKLGIEYDSFVRTTDETHKKIVTENFSKLVEKDFIYKGNYEGLYCKSCETFLTQTQLTDGKCPECGREVEKVSEESYFLKVSDFKDFVKEKLQSGNVLLSKNRIDELVNNFVDDLQDLSVTRTSFEWGIPINEDQKHIIYVWLDALQNYLTTFEINKKEGWSIDEVWGKDSNIEILQLVGKEITRFHAIYWPIILEMLGYRQPRVLAHGWIVTDSGEKMSKSKGNVIDPIKLIDQYGRDAIRYYLINNIETGKDGKFSDKLLIEEINGILVNKYSNLVSRTNAMNKKYFDGVVPSQGKVGQHEDDLWDKINQEIKTYKEQMNSYQFSASTKTAIRVVEALNLYIDKTEPWKISVEEGLDTVINNLVKGIYVSTTLLAPALIDTSEVVSKWLGEELSLENLEKDFSGKTLDELPHLFERIK